MEKVVIDLSQGRDLSESFLRMFGAGITSILKAMFGGETVPVSVKGSPQEIKAFANVLSKEKKYMDAYKRMGLDNPETYRSRFALNKAIRDFERKTNLIYPLK